MLGAQWIKSTFLTFPPTPETDAKPDSATSCLMFMVEFHRALVSVLYCSSFILNIYQMSCIYFLQCLDTGPFCQSEHVWHHGLMYSSWFWAALSSDTVSRKQLHRWTAHKGAQYIFIVGIKRASSSWSSGPVSSSQRSSLRTTRSQEPRHVSAKGSHREQRSIYRRH